MKFILKKMKKWNTFYLLLVVVLAIVILKTSCMEDQKQDEATLKSKAVLENISERKSVRKYLSKSVEEDKIDAMLKAGMAAPSGMDRRPWEFVVVTDRVALDSMAAKLPYAKMLTSVPLAIVVCGDRRFPPIGTWIARRQRRIYCWQLRLWGLVLCGRRLILMKIELMLYGRIRDYQRI